MMSDKKKGAETKAKWWRVKETEQSLKEKKHYDSIQFVRFQL